MKKSFWYVYRAYIYGSFIRAFIAAGLSAIEMVDWKTREYRAVLLQSRNCSGKMTSYTLPLILYNTMFIGILVILFVSRSRRKSSACLAPRQHRPERHRTTQLRTPPWSPRSNMGNPSQWAAPNPNSPRMMTTRPSNSPRMMTTRPSNSPRIMTLPKAQKKTVNFHKDEKSISSLSDPPEAVEPPPWTGESPSTDRSPASSSQPMRGGGGGGVEIVSPLSLPLEKASREREEEEHSAGAPSSSSRQGETDGLLSPNIQRKIVNAKSPLGSRKARPQGLIGALKSHLPSSLKGTIQKCESEWEIFCVRVCVCVCVATIHIRAWSVLKSTRTFY